MEATARDVMLKTCVQQATEQVSTLLVAVSMLCNGRRTISVSGSSPEIKSRKISPTSHQIPRIGAYRPRTCKDRAISIKVSRDSVSCLCVANC